MVNVLECFHAYSMQNDNFHTPRSQKSEGALGSPTGPVDAMADSGHGKRI